MKTKSVFVVQFYAITPDGKDDYEGVRGVFENKDSAWEHASEFEKETGFPTYVVPYVLN